MSRFLGKNAIPISLIKEKENKSATTATRSASCSIGKWGNVAFTSTRYSLQAQQTLIAQTEEADLKKVEKLDREDSVSPPPEPVKPKKFFKSRNTAARVLIIPTAPQTRESIQIEAEEQSVVNQPKQNKHQAYRNYQHFSSSSEHGGISFSSEQQQHVSEKSKRNIDHDTISTKKVKKEREKQKDDRDKEANVIPPKSIGTRCSTRNKKIVNYNLDEVVNVVSSTIKIKEKDTNVAQQSLSSTNQGKQTSTNLNSPSSQIPSLTPQNQSVDHPIEHPPIVLRISKGTSQIVSAESSIGNSTSDNESKNTTATKKEVNYSDLNYCTVKISSDKPPKERLKLIIKTADLSAQYNNEIVPNADENSRSLISPSFVSDKDFDSQSSVIGSNSSKFTITSKFPGPSDVTSDLDTSQHSSLVAAPSDIESRLESMMEPLDDSNERKFEEPLKDDILEVLTGGEHKEEHITNEVESTDFPTRRSTRNKSKVECSPTKIKITIHPIEERDEISEEISPKRRFNTRNVKQNVFHSSTYSEETVKPIKVYGRKKRKSIVISGNTEPDIIEDDDRDVVLPPKLVPVKKIKKSKIIEEDLSQIHDLEVQRKEEVGSVKLVISKKKGSIYKSRTEEAVTKKKHVYKHTWDIDDNETIHSFRKDISIESEVPKKNKKISTLYDDFNSSDEESLNLKNNLATPSSSVKVKNVKTAHQIQEIGEFQEMDDDIEYILDALQSHNQIPTRCLSALQLASKCMTPAFRMHVRAHGTVTKFFRALHDSKNDLSLGLCTSTIMYVLSQDTLNMDLDRDSLELMLNLLEVNSNKSLSHDQLHYFEKTKGKVREICEEIKNQGKGEHLNLENISVGSLAMETLLSLTSKRAGTWFVEGLRESGGIDHILKTICECSDEISDYVISWSDGLITKLITIERCLRVLENVTQGNEANQNYIISHNYGNTVDVLFKLFKLCDGEMITHPTTSSTPKDYPGVILRETLIPTLKVLTNLTHTSNRNDNSPGSLVFGQKHGIFEICFHILLQSSNYVPEKCIFEFNILVLLLLINLTMHVEENKCKIMGLNIETKSEKKVLAVEAITQYFYDCQDLACVVEQNTDEILNETNKNKKDEMDETVNNLHKNAGHHMEYTLKASYSGILIGNLIKNNKENESIFRKYLRNHVFRDLVVVLEKYYSFMNLTANSEASVLAHMNSTKDIIEYFKNVDVEHIP